VSASGEPSRPGLARQLGLWSAVAVLVGSTIGSGIFRTPSGIAKDLPGVVPVLGIWLAGGLFALCGALALAEMSSAYPQTGGLYVLLREAWGRPWAFLFGWAQLAVVRAAALGAVSTTFAEYFLRLWGYDTKHPAVAPWVHYMAAIAIVITAACNYVGLRWGALVQNATSLAKFLGLAFIVVVALTLGMDTTGAQFTPMIPDQPVAVAAYGSALVAVLWSFDGWADLTFVAGEVKDPGRNLPRALLIGVIAVTAIYLFANLAYFAVMTVADVQKSTLVAADAAKLALGPPGVVLVSITVMVSTFGTLNGTLLTTPRIFFAMADDGLLFRQIAAVHPRYGTPHVAIVLSTALGVAFVLAQTFEQLIDAFVTGLIPFYALGIAGIFVLRRRPGYAPTFRMPGAPLIPLLFIASVLFLLVTSLLDDEGGTWAAGVLGVVALGLPVYYATVGRRRPSPRAAP
jgi:amino acid transporter